MKYFLLIAFALSMTLPASNLFSGEADKKLCEMGLYPTVKLTYPRSSECDCEECRKAKSTGSGVLISSVKGVMKSLIAPKEYFVNVVLTAQHNVESIKNDKVPLIIHVAKYKNDDEFDKFIEYQAIVYDSNKDLDLAVLLFISEEQMPVAKLGMDTKLHLGNEIIKFGYGLGDDVRFDEGKITSVKTVVPETMAGKVRTNAHTIFGDSGGPVYDKEYNLIGISHAIRAENSYILTVQSYFAPLSGVKTWSESSNNIVGFVYKEQQLPTYTLFRLCLRDIEIIGEKK